MERLSYRKVPFGEDVAFQLSLYEHRLLSKEKSPQFKGIGSKRIHHKSSTKPAFDQLGVATEEESKDMLIYLDKQTALSINPQTNELRGVKKISGGRIHTYQRPQRRMTMEGGFQMHFPMQQRESDLFSLA